MDRALIEDKLESLRRCVKRVSEKCPATVSELEGNLDLQDILTLNLSRAIQICVDIGAHMIASLDVRAPQTMGETFDILVSEGYLSPESGIRMKKAVGFRNIAVHNYKAIDWAIVLSLCTHNLDDFAAFAREIARRL